MFRYGKKVRQEYREKGDYSHRIEGRWKESYFLKRVILPWEKEMSFQLEVRQLEAALFYRLKRRHGLLLLNVSVVLCSRGIERRECVQLLRNSSIEFDRDEQAR